MSLPKPSYGSSTVRSVDVVSSPSEGVYHRRKRGLVYRHWRLVYEAGQATTAQIAAVIALWQANGHRVRFALTPPGESVPRDVVFDSEMQELSLSVQSMRAAGFAVAVREDLPA